MWVGWWWVAAAAVLAAVCLLPHSQPAAALIQVHIVPRNAAPGPRPVLMTLPLGAGNDPPPPRWPLPIPRLPPSSAPPTPPIRHPNSATRSPSLEMEESPRYFTPPERASPSPRSAYFDTVSSARSPKTKSPRPSASNKENYFTFDAPSTLRKHVLDCCSKLETLDCDDDGAANVRRQRLKSISLDSDNARIIEENLGLPIAKHLKEQMNEEVSASCRTVERNDEVETVQRPIFEFDRVPKEPENAEEPSTPDLTQKKGLRQSSDTQSFLDMPRFSPKEFEIIVTNEDGTTTDVNTKRKDKNLRNLTIDLTKRDSELEKELLEFEKLYTTAEEKKVKTPTLKVKATSLDSSESVNLSLPQKKTLDVPQNSVSVPNTPKRQIKRLLAQKKMHEQFCGAKAGYNSIQYTAEQRKMFLKAQDSGIFLRENHANLMLYQPSVSRSISRAMGSFDENLTDYTETEAPEINVCGVDVRHCDTLSLGADLATYKPNLSVSSTNLKTLPEGVSSDDFEPSADDDKFAKKLHRRNSNQSLLYSFDGKYTTHSLQGSNWSLSSGGASCHNLSVRTSASNFSLNTDNRPKRLSLERRESSASADVQPRNCLLQRRGSNNSLTLNLSRHATSTPRKGLLERRSSNASLTLNIASSSPHLAPAPTTLPPAPVPTSQRKSLSTESLAPVMSIGTSTGSTGVITTEPLSPQSTSEEFRQYLANMHHLQTASSVLTREKLKDLHELFQNGYSKAKCKDVMDGECGCKGRVTDSSNAPCFWYQQRLIRALHQEFWDMPGNFQDKPLVSGSAPKNRYRAVLPNEHSRVVLGNCRYVNANYVKGYDYTKNCYIATQGPLQNTIFDFWYMVYQNCKESGPDRVQKVVMLTNLVENNRHKCEKYFPLEIGEEFISEDPESEEEDNRSKFVVKNSGLIKKCGYSIRRLDVEYVQNDNNRDQVTVYHYWFQNWADHKCPVDVLSLLNLTLDILENRSYGFCENIVCDENDEVSLGDWESSGPAAVVHCSAGVGRTGCLLAVLAGARQLRAERRVDVLAAVSGLRLARGGMVQTSEQYELVHKVLAALYHYCMAELDS